MRRQDWAAFAAVGATILALIGALAGRPWLAVGSVGVAFATGTAARTWSRKYPGPMPYAIRWVLLGPRGPQSPAHLQRILEPRSGERILEVGPGVGVYALPVAEALLPDGVLEVLDIQQEMLDDLSRRAREAGITNVIAKCADARTLPYPDRTFDAVYLIGVLGEIPEPVGALREVRRVLKPEGRVVVGETVIDPDYVSPSELAAEAAEAGFAFERRSGTRLCYFESFRASDTGDRTVTDPTDAAVNE